MRSGCKFQVYLNARMVFECCSVYLTAAGCFLVRDYILSACITQIWSHDRLHECTDYKCPDMNPYGRVFHYHRPPMQHEYHGWSCVFDTGEDFESGDPAPIAPPPADALYDDQATYDTKVIASMREGKLHNQWPELTDTMICGYCCQTAKRVCTYC